jgi:L-fucose mutarotase
MMMGTKMPITTLLSHKECPNTTARTIVSHRSQQHQQSSSTAPDHTQYKIHSDNNTMGLLKGIDPLLTADLLYVLRSMGHGDKLCLCDCNFPAAEVATKTTSKRLVVLTVPLPEAASAICSALPLDFFVESPVSYMAPSEGLSLPPEGAQVIEATQSAITAHAKGVKMTPIERFAFYEAARTCYAVVQTMERRPYGNVILQKGVIGPDGKDLMP